MVRACMSGLCLYGFITLCWSTGLFPMSHVAKFTAACGYCCCWFASLFNLFIFYLLRISSIWSSGEPICGTEREAR